MAFDFFSLLNPINVLDIAIVAIFIYKLIDMIKETRAVQLLKGILLLVVFTVISEMLGLTTVNWLLDQTQTVLILAIPIVFQPELRRALERLGNSNFWNPGSGINSSQKEVDYIIEQLMSFLVNSSKENKGVLLAIQGEEGLGEYAATGIRIDGHLSSQLLSNIFIVNTPLHDGAVIIDNTTIVAASCYLPLSENKNINKALGTRHRAGIGLSEVTDAVVCIVSEETGAMSIAKNGHLYWNLNETKLRKKLSEELRPREQKTFIQKWREEYVDKRKK